ncbi:hypothetical protein TRAPUB_4053 [Trametes pubescens]|uniref:Uncharacterized protein n=1 Tax=Trametes pubescens TaxID=154538 RepID=A0A1M2VC51_TRAPU|nr:hypothetical protein TRAPUB_4053 [Trametes pubescens]
MVGEGGKSSRKRARSEGLGERDPSTESPKAKRVRIEVPPQDISEAERDDDESSEEFDADTLHVKTCEYFLGLEPLYAEIWRPSMVGRTGAPSPLLSIATGTLATRPK